MVLSICRCVSGIMALTHIRTENCYKVSKTYDRINKGKTTDQMKRRMVVLKLSIYMYAGWERTGHVLCIVDTSLSVLMTLRMCLRELCCLFGIFCCLDLNHLVRVFYLFMFS